MLYEVITAQVIDVVVAIFGETVIDANKTVVRCRHLDAAAGRVFGPVGLDIGAEGPEP